MSETTSSTISRRGFVAGAAGVAAAGAVATAIPGVARAEEAAAGGAADGTYTSSVEGRNGLVTVEVTIAGGKISAVEVTDHQETEVFTVDAIPQLCENIVAANSFGIDGISGATFTSAAILTAVRDCIEQAGGDVEAYNVPTSYEPGTDETFEADVVVVGGGMSGILCAARAAEAGATVALVEKVRLVGGCSLMSFSCASYTDDVVRDTMISWVQNQMYLADSTVIYAYLKNTIPAIDYLAGATTSASMFPSWGDPESIFPGMLVDYMQRPVVYDELLSNTVLANGGAVYTEHTVTEILTDADGAACGIVASRKDGSTLTVNAKAVVIATGGYGGNTQLLKELTGYDVVCGCLTQDVGEGMEMAWAAGAAKPVSLGGMMLHQTLATAKLRGYEYFQQQMPMILGYVPSVLDLTTAGVRFRNEDWVNTAVAAANGGAFAGGITYAMLDQAMVDALMSGGTAAIGFTESPGMPPEYKPEFEPDTPWDQFQTVLDDCVANGWAFSGDSIEALAEAAGMDASVLQSTVDTYNAYCEAGADDYFGKDPAHLVALTTAPYYLVQITYNQLGTVGGITVNDQFQALDASHLAVPGLYSVGADAYGSCWNRNYYGTGDGIGFALVSGYLAGPIVAAYALGE